MVFGLIFGIFFIYKSKKLEADLLLYAGILVIFTGLFYLGASADFLSVLFTGNNLDNRFGLHGILAYMWVAPAVIVAMNIGAEIMFPEKKKIIIIIYAALGIIFELFLFLDTNNAFTFALNEDVIDSSFNRTHPTFFFIAFFLATVFVFIGIGFLIKSRQASGEIRKKFAYISLGFILFVICGALDSLVAPGIFLIIIRIGMISYAWLVYLGLKPS
ncbi:MAG: hypothetical protein EU532_10785 [Promethearchaeota archaeon]|nr:MAG: hypothetical protein EU532_10785 [Candidatus Lokiarchaeota archaeon]